MFYKGIIFDLDNTLYDYNACHDFALESVFEYLRDVYPSTNINKSLYEKIAKDLKKELINTASCHNKSIYFKQLLEHLNVGLLSFSPIHDIYWRSFYTKIKCFDGVKEFIQWNKQQNIKIAVLTDYETEHQITKLEKLGLLDYVDVVVTSEEVGKEKPSKQMFLSVLNKMSLSAESAIMVGDNFEKDIVGAMDMNIFAYWLNDYTEQKNKKYIPFISYTTLLTDFISIYNDLTNLKRISKFYGERFDLVQAGGGNTSVKTRNGWLIIKSSGYNLTSVDTQNGYVIADNDKIIQDIETKHVNDVTSYNVIGTKRASIETFMHSLLKKYTVHLHPIQVNRILVCKHARDIINKIYPNSLIIDYLTPGIKVCGKIKELYSNENVIFLLNHGIIVTSDNINELHELIDDILVKFEKEQQIMGFEKYKFTNTLTSIVNKKFHLDNVSYLVDDSIINTYLIHNKQLFYTNVTFPDALVYCGESILEGLANIHQCNECPKIIVENNTVYITGNTLAKCKEIEDVLKSVLIIADSEMDKNYLTSEEIYFLNNWEAEKYRKII